MSGASDTIAVLGTLKLKGAAQYLQEVLDEAQSNSASYVEFLDQLLSVEITDRAVICLNLMDEARRRGLQVDDRRLARDLGVPVVPTAARSGEGIPDLLQAVDDVASGRTVCRPHRVQGQPTALRQAVDTLVGRTLQAAEHQQLDRIVIAGGVGANKLLRSDMQARFTGQVFYPRMAYCTDNGAMIAVAGALRLGDASRADEIRAQARWALNTLGRPAAAG